MQLCVRRRRRRMGRIRTWQLQQRLRTLLVVLTESLRSLRVSPLVQDHLPHRFRGSMLFPRLAEHLQVSGMWTVGLHVI